MTSAVFTIGLAAVVALFFALRETPSLILAWRNGVVNTRSTPPKTVLLREEPERFRKLVRQRLIGAGTGVGFLVATIVVVALRAMGIELPSRFG